MGCIPLKRTVSDGGGSPAARYASELTAYYSEACRLEPQLLSLEPALHRSTSRVISAVAADAADLHSLSFKSLLEATDGLADVTRDALASILDLKDEIADNPDLLFFINQHFRSNVDLLYFFAAVRRCLRHARDAESLARAAVDCLLAGDLAACLARLREFLAAGDPFTESFVGEFRSVCEAQGAVLAALRARKRELDKKLGSLRAWGKVWSVVYAVALAASLVCSVVLAAIVAPPAVIAVSSAMSAALPPAWEWMETAWSGRAAAVEDEAAVVGELKGGATFAIHELESIRLLAQKVEVRLAPLVHGAELASAAGEEAVTAAMDEMERKLWAFGRSVEDLELELDRCSGNLREVMSAIFKAVTNE